MKLLRSGAGYPSLPSAAYAIVLTLLNVTIDGFCQTLQIAHAMGKRRGRLPLALLKPFRSRTRWLQRWLCDCRHRRRCRHSLSMRWKDCTARRAGLSLSVPRQRAPIFVDIYARMPDGMMAKAFSMRLRPCVKRNLVIRVWRWHTTAIRCKRPLMGATMPCEKAGAGCHHR